MGGTERESIAKAGAGEHAQGASQFGGGLGDAKAAGGDGQNAEVIPRVAVALQLSSGR